MRENKDVQLGLGRIFVLDEAADVESCKVLVDGGDTEVVVADALRRIPKLADLYDVVILCRDDSAELKAAWRLDSQVCQAGAQSCHVKALPGWQLGEAWRDWFIRTLKHEPELRLQAAWLQWLDDLPDAEFKSKTNGHTNGHSSNGNGHANGHTKNGRQREPDAWPALRLDEPSPTIPFPIQHFPSVLRDYALELSATILTPVDMVAGSMLAVASAAIGQSVNIWLKGKGRSAWIEPPLLWVMLVARPGFAKSPAIRIPAMPLTDCDRKLRLSSSEAYDRWKKLDAAFRSAGSRKAKSRSVAIDGFEKPAITLPDDDPPEDPGAEPPQHRCVVKDATRETLAELLRDNPRGLLCDPDEALNWVGSFNEYKGGGKGRDRQFWLSLFNCEPISVDRAGGRKSIYVHRPFCSVLAGIQPDLVGSLQDDRGRDDGFMDRILFICPDTRQWPKQHWNEVEVNEYSEAAWFNSVARLRSRPMFDDAELGYQRAWNIQLDDEAREAWKSAHNSHVDETLDPEEPSRHAGAAQKMRALAGRLALISSQLRLAATPGELGSPGRVGVRDVEAAWDMVRFFRSQLDRIGSTATGPYAHTGASKLLGWIQRGRRASFRIAEPKQDIRLFRDQDSLDRAIQRLEQAGVIRPAGGRNPGRQAGRLPSAEYDVNPDLWGAPEKPENPGYCAHVQANSYTGVQFPGFPGFSGATLDMRAQGREPGEDDL